MNVRSMTEYQEAPPGIEQAYADVLRAVKFAGLSSFEAQDVAQDVFLWLLQRRPLLEIPDPLWLAAVVRNFIRRYWRENRVRKARESRAAKEGIVLLRRVDHPDALDLQYALDQIERRLPRVEARLLRLVRRGCSCTEAARRLGIPRGSVTFFRKKLLEHVTVVLRAPPQYAPEGVVG